METPTRIDEIIQTYKERVRNSARVESITLPVESYFFDSLPAQLSVTLDCWVIDDNNRPKGFTGNKKEGLQYDLRTALPTEGRIRAWRVPFLGHRCYTVKGYTVSHLCHNDICVNWDHHCFEPLYVNKGRNGCPGGLHCHHQTRCIRPGPYYNF